MVLPERKPNRLCGYDYSQNGAYFITICTKDKQNLFWNNVGARIARPQNEMSLSEYGVVVENAIKSISTYYPCVSVNKYVVMPNHVHLILIISSDIGGRAMRAPTIGTIINQMKGWVSKQLGFSPWQKLFHDHIIRGERDYEEIWQYIDTNPYKWSEDCFFTETNKKIPPSAQHKGGKGKTGKR